MNIEEINNVINNWQTRVQKDITINDIFIFGSSIINKGFLFDDGTSDIDLVILMPENLSNAIERTNWIESLKMHKSKLEGSFIELFKRKQTNEPIVSIIPITNTELTYDIHKSGVRDFFKDNEFLNLNSNQIVNGLIKEKGLNQLDNIIRNLLEFSQNIRNKYLAIGLIDDKDLLNWQSDIDVAPKELIRSSALAAYVENGKKEVKEKTDLKIGLSHLQHYFYSRRFEHPLYLKLYDWLSKRLLRKGKLQNLESIDYIFLSEVIFDMALSLIPIETSEKDIDLSKNRISEIDINNSIESNFFIAKSGLIRGDENEIFKEILNAGINLSWKTKPHFKITLEEIDYLEKEILKHPKNGEYIDKLRKLKIIHRDLIDGYNYIIYYQNLLFKGSNEILSDVLTALRKFTLTRFKNRLLNKNYKGVEEGFLQAYFNDYENINNRFPNNKINAVLKFGLPDEELNSFLKTNKALNEKYENVDIMALAAFNQPISSIKTNLLASFFVPLLIQKLIESDNKAIIEDIESQTFNETITNLRNWSFGIM
jgi:Pol beta superfamily nucleotidyltransferase in conflict systems